MLIKHTAPVAQRRRKSLRGNATDKIYRRCDAAIAVSTRMERLPSRDCRRRCSRHAAAAYPSCPRCCMMSSSSVSRHALRCTSFARALCPIQSTRARRARSSASLFCAMLPRRRGSVCRKVRCSARAQEGTAEKAYREQQYNAAVVAHASNGSTGYSSQNAHPAGT